MAAHAQRGLPAFSIYGQTTVQDASDTTIPDDVAKKIIAFARGAVAVGMMKNKAYVNLGSISMGIAGSFCDANFMQKYLGLRAEWVDMTEILRRITLEIYDKEEYEAAITWIKANCKEGFDTNADKNLPEIIRKSKVVPADKDWEFIAKFTLIIVRDILPWKSQAVGRNGLAGRISWAGTLLVGGFQGQRMWTDWLPNGRFHLKPCYGLQLSTGTAKKPPFPFATENDTLNGISMLFAKLLTGKAPCFHDVRTYWSLDAVERVTGKTLEGRAKDGFIHLINSGATALDCTGCAKDAQGNGTVKEWWNMEDSDIKACLDATDWCRANYEYFRGGGFSSHFKTQAEMPVTMVRVNLIDGVGPTLQIAEGYTVTLDERCS